MKKKSFMMLIILILTLQFLFMAAIAEDSGEASVQTLYNAMVRIFNEEDYERAYEIAIEIESKGGQNYSDANLYIGYLKGWDAINKDDLDIAISYFRPLVAAGFEKSEGYYNYLLGRKEQDSGNYADAISYYETASTQGVFVGVTYQSECEILMQSSAYDAADRYEKQGNYLAAAEAFAALGSYSDSDSREKENYYLYAGELSKQSKYEEAAEIYNMLGTYKDSADQAARAYQLFQNGNANVSFSELGYSAVDAQSVKLEWNDSQELGAYTVSYYPMDMVDDAKSVTTSECSCEISGLLPGTKYHVEITSQRNATASLSGSFETSQAVVSTELAPYGEWVYTFSQHDLINSSIDRLVEGGKVQEIGDAILQVQNRKLSDAGTGCVICSLDKREPTEEDEEYDVLCVVRAGSGFVASIESKESKTGKSTYVPFNVDITSLLDKAYDFYEGWPSGSAYADLYVNGCLLTQLNFVIECIQ